MATRDKDGQIQRARPVLLCFDGSDDALHAIAEAGEMLGGGSAVVLSVWEPVALWQPYDPATAITAPLSRLASNALGLDDITQELAAERATAGVELARRAGFDARERVAKGKPWRVICDVADDLDAEVIVLGARGLSRVQSALLGSVSAAVVQHARRPVLVVPCHVRADRHDARGKSGHDHLRPGNGEGEEATRRRDQHRRDVQTGHPRTPAGDQA